MRPILLLLGWACIFSVPAATARERAGDQAQILSNELDAGTMVSGVAREDEATLHAFLALSGDVVEVTLRGSGALELVVYGPNGAVLSRLQGQGYVPGRITAAADGAHFVAVLAEPGSRYSIALKREAAAQVRQFEYPPWGVYSELAGRTADTAGAHMEWSWDTPGKLLVERLYLPGGKTPLVSACIRLATPQLELEAPGVSMVGDVSPADGAVTWRFRNATTAASKAGLRGEDTLIVTHLDRAGQESVFRLGARSAAPAEAVAERGCQGPRTGS
jgi:hypothetical protein